MFNEVPMDGRMAVYFRENISGKMRDYVEAVGSEKDNLFDELQETAIDVWENQVPIVSRKVFDTSSLSTDLDVDNKADEEIKRMLKEHFL